MTTPRYALCSIHAASRIFGRSRERIRKAVVEGSLQSPLEEKGHALYRIREIAELLYGATGTKRKDVSEMSPSEAAMHWQAELRRLEVEQRAGLLVWATDCREQMAVIVKHFTRFLDILPDVLERDAGISHEQIETVEKAIHAMREDLYQSLKADETGS